LAGLLMSTLSKVKSWQNPYLLLAVVIFGISIYHWWALPKNYLKSHSRKKTIVNAYRKTIRSFFFQKNFLYILTFLIIYNSAEAQLLKVVPLYLLDSSAHGGAHLNTSQVGLLFGGIGTASMLLGAIITGILVARYTLKKVILPVTLFISVVNLGYFIVSAYHVNSIVWLSLVIVLAQFGFGLGNSAFMSKMLHLSTGKPYQMSFYALATALMSIGMIVPGAVSGYMQQKLGYEGFFMWVFLLGIFILMFTYVFKRVEINEYKSA